MQNIRISIADLIQACRELGEVKIVAAGNSYATLETNSSQRKRLLVEWQFD